MSVRVYTVMYILPVVWTKCFESCLYLSNFIINHHGKLVKREEISVTNITKTHETSLPTQTIMIVPLDRIRAQIRKSGPGFIKWSYFIIGQAREKRATECYL